MANRLRILPVLKHTDAFDLGRLYSERDALLREARLLRMLLHELERQPLATTRIQQKTAASLMQARIDRARRVSRKYRRLMRIKG